MTEQSTWKPHRYMLAWGIAALVAIVAIFATIGLALYYIPRPTGIVYPYYGFFPFRFFFAIFFIFAIFWFFRWAFWGWRWHYRGGYWGGYGYWRHRDGAYYILRERYAKGEITKEQYDQMVRNLEQHRTSP